MIKAYQPLFNNKTGALFDIFFTGSVYLTKVHNKDNVKQVRRTAGLNDAEIAPVVSSVQLKCLGGGLSDFII
jgi:hypothetical protein